MEIALMMHLLGFESASQSKLNYLLPKVNCNGYTAFRDAVFKGNQLMLEIYKQCCKFNIQNQYKLVHVVLTDGEDNRSTLSQVDFLAYYYILKEALPKNILQTFYIGVNVENNKTVKQQMQDILKCSGDAAQYYSISSNGINEIFQKIQMQIGIRVQERNIVIGNQQAILSLRQQQVQPTLQFQYNNYIVLFTLDISQSMQSDWNKVCQAVKGFLGNLGSDDFVLGIVFNEQVNVLSGNQIEESNQNEENNSYNHSDQQYEQSQLDNQFEYIDNGNDNESDQCENQQLTPNQQTTQEAVKSYPQSKQQPQKYLEVQQQSQQQQQQQYQYQEQQQQQYQQNSIDKPQNQNCSCQITCQIF